MPSTSRTTKPREPSAKTLQKWHETAMRSREVVGTRPNGHAQYRMPNDVPPKVANCPLCDEPTIKGAIAGVDYRLSRFSITVTEALTLWKFGQPVYNVWHKDSPMKGWRCQDWVYPNRPMRGRLYTAHVCGIWR